MSMFGRSPRFVLRFAFMLALAVQVILPGQIAVSKNHPGAFGLHQLICVPNGALSAEAEAAAQALAEALGEVNEPEAPEHDHCGLCVLSLSALPVELSTLGPVGVSAISSTTLLDGVVVALHRVLPLGSRAPPVSI